MPHSRVSLCLKTVELSSENHTEEEKKKKREIKNAKFFCCHLYLKINFLNKFNFQMYLSLKMSLQILYVFNIFPF